LAVGGWKSCKRNAHWSEYERLVQSGELEKHLVQPPSKTAYFISYVLGFSLITFGLFLLALVVIGLFEKGLV